jgi:hypothetical protein
MMASILDSDIKTSIVKGRSLLTAEQRSSMDRRVRYKTSAISNCLSKRIAQYFYKWQKYTMEHRTRVMKNCKVLMIRAWRNAYKTYFNKWRETGLKKQKKKRTLIVEEVQMDQNTISNELNQLT